MGFRTSFTPTVSISGVLGFFALAAVTGWLTFPRFAGPRFEVKASILVCDSVPLKGGTVAWKLSLDKAPGEVRLEAPAELDRSLSALCARKPRVRVVSRENNGIFSVQELEDVESGTVLVSEREVLEKSRRQRIRAGAATGVLALLGVVCGVMGLLAARTPAPRRTSSPSPQGRSSPMTPRTSTSPSSRPVSVTRGTTDSTVPNEPVPAAPSVSAPLHITPISVELRPSRPRYVPGILAILAFLVGLRPVLKVMSEEGWKPIFGPVLLAKVYTKGIYSGTTTELTLVAANGRRIAFKTHGFDVDEDLMAVHARILPSVTQWMKSRLEAGHPVLWGSEAFLKRDGLRLVNNHESLVHPFSGLKFRRDKDVLHVSNWRGGALFSLRASELNFHPCLQLAEELAAAEKSRAASA